MAMTVLFIDDETHIRQLVEYNLRLDGFEVFLADNGKSGLEMVKEHHPDLILLDVMMPEMDGLEVLAKLKNDKKTRDLPVFMLTAKGMIADIKRAFAIGADDYIPKPFDPAQLGEMIKQKLESLKNKEADSI
jgi:two-component system, OmpR family, alkaline phosphatase synthesis response regulator PhoP